MKFFRSSRVATYGTHVIEYQTIFKLKTIALILSQGVTVKDKITQMLHKHIHRGKGYSTALKK
ncbi:MAG TPA: hypothetical protein PK047_10165 [Saprospiraceae bacterium]|nr:hypothetical protein [Saprospiraceae bacterium]HRO09221.1 hypothetical protein [Saprospiraceae bacterium]HRP42583.1 hypothetical protein [Saprospiraceae bacterium]